MNQPTSLLRRSSKSSSPVRKADEAMTPPMGSRVRSSSVDSYDEDYFSKTYVPLSNLPTPPMSSHSDASMSQQPSDALFLPGVHLDPELIGPAIHLTNLIPTSTSLTPASTPLIHALLTRASLPLETIALAVCILDSLNSRFALHWRKSCPLDTPAHAHAPNTCPHQLQHVDSIRPELIPLSALILAVKFLDDAQQSTREYANQWGRNLWTCEQLNYTQWCLMDNLGGRLLPLWDQSIIFGALEDMKRAGRPFPSRNVEAEWTCAIHLEELNADIANNRERAFSAGHAVVGLGEQLTPMDTPLGESFQATNDEQSESASAGSTGGIQEYFEVPHTNTRSLLPEHVDPSRGLGY